MHIHYNTNQTTLPLELSIILPSNHIVFTIEEVVNDLEDLIRDLFIDLTLRLKTEELVTLDCLFIDGTKIEANANKYSFVWKKDVDKFSDKLQENIRRSFQEDISPLIEEGSHIFAKRKSDVEPVFGQIKACLGYRRCQLRSKRQVTIDMGLVLMANNLLKYYKRRSQN